MTFPFKIGPFSRDIREFSGVGGGLKKKLCLIVTFWYQKNSPDSSNSQVEKTWDRISQILEKANNNGEVETCCNDCKQHGSAINTQSTWKTCRKYHFLRQLDGWF